MMTKTHHYMNLNKSPLPFLASTSVMNLVLALLIFMKSTNLENMILSMINVITISFLWWMSYSKEFNSEGNTTFTMEQGVKMAMILFISSEIFFFSSFFWSYFHYFSSPNMVTGLLWPPVGLKMFEYNKVPLINTLILLTSGVTVTLSHMYINEKNLKKSMSMLIMTFSLGVLFTLLQLQEYNSAFFTMTDSSFGTVFFTLTGFHGIHVLIGTMFLMITAKNMQKISCSKKEYLSFELAAWYWHFVDVVWMILYFLLYYLNF